MAEEPKDKGALSTKEEKKRAKKEKKKRKRELLDATQTSTTARTDSAASANEKAAAAASEDDDDDDESFKHNTGNNDKKQERRKTKRRLEREALLEQVPKVDAVTGMAYTKQQIRRMRKRVARGLNPLETPAEKHARLVRDAELRKEEEAELAGLLIVTKNQKNVDEQSDDDNNNDDDDEDEDDRSEDEDEKDGVATKDEGTDEAPFSYEKAPKDAAETLAEQPPPRKKKKRDKPVPVDYVCSACQNAISGAPPHWIYDCPHKKTVPGTNQVSRKQRGLHNPSDHKLFVSGLPFDATAKDVMAMFAAKLEAEAPASGSSSSSDAAALVSHCKLIKFADTGRCKGQAFVTFATADAAQQALRLLNGAVIENPAAPLPLSADAKKKTKQNEAAASAPNKRKEQLKLKVTKVLNRFLTKTKK